MEKKFKISNAALKGFANLFVFSSVVTSLFGSFFLFGEHDCPKCLRK